MMQVEKLFKENKCDTFYRLGQEIGAGADGQCFELSDDKNKIIKFSVLYECSHVNLDLVYNNIDKVLSFIQKNPNDAFVKVYNHTFAGSFNRLSFGNNVEKYILYYYVMDKLQKITEDEKKVFSTILSHEDCNKVKNYSIEKIKEILSYLSVGLDFDCKKITLFCENLKNYPVHHLDIHPRNILKDLNGNFKLIDLDRCNLNLIGDTYERN